MISKHVLDQCQDYSRQFATALPFRHVVIDDFLEQSACQALLDKFPSFDQRFALNEMGGIGNKALAVTIFVGAATDVVRIVEKFWNAGDGRDHGEKIC